MPNVDVSISRSEMHEIFKNCRVCGEEDLSRKTFVNLKINPLPRLFKVIVARTGDETATKRAN